MPIKKSNKSFLNLGNVQIQPAKKIKKINNISTEIVEKQNISSKTLNAQVEPTKPSVTSANLLSQVEKYKTSGLKSVAASAVSGKKTGIESLTNISEKRPEVIALTNFHPLFSSAGGELTEHGKLFDTYIETMRQLETAAAQAVQNDTLWSEETRKKNEEIKTQISIVRDVVQNIYDILRKLSIDRARLSLHHPDYKFSYSEFVNSNLDANSKVDIEALKGSFSASGLESNLTDFIERLTGIPLPVVRKFSSTKLWMLFLKEARFLLENYSRDLVENPKYSYEENLSNPNTGFGNTANTENNFSVINNQSNSSLKISLKLLQDVGSIKQKTAELSTIDTIIALLDEAVRQIPSGIIGYYAEDQNFNKFFTKKLDYCQEAAQIENIILSLAEAMVSVDGLMANQLIIDPISLGLNLIMKEMRYSSCYNASSEKLLNAINNLSGIQTEESSIFDMFGKTANGFNVFEPSPEDKNGLAGFCYYDATSVDTIATLEAEKINATIKDGGNYFFDQSKIVQFKENNTTYDLLTRLELLLQKVVSLDDSFSSVATELGLLSIDDTKLLDKEKKADGIFSSNPQKFLLNIFNNLTNELQKVDSVTSSNSNLGVNTLIKYSSTGQPQTRLLRSVLFIMAYLEGEKDTGLIGQNTYVILETILTRIINDISKSMVNGESAGSVNELIGNEAELFSVIMGYYNKLDDEDGESPGSKGRQTAIEKSRIPSAYKMNGASCLPCRYHTPQDLGLAIRNNPTFVYMVKVIKNVKDIFYAYASDGGEDTSFGKINIFTILIVLFNTMCKIVEKSESHTVGWTRTVFNQSSLSRNIYKTIKNMDENDSGEDTIFYNFLNKVSIVPLKQGSVWFIEIFSKMSDVPVDREILKLSTTIKLGRENFSANGSVLLLLNTIKTFRKNIESSIDTLKKLDSTKLLTLASYMDSRRYLEFLLVEPQLTLLLSNVEDLFLNFKNFSDVVDTSGNDSKASFINYQETLAHSKKVVDILKNYFSAEEFQSYQGYDKKIITIGLPQGLIKEYVNNAIQAQVKYNKHNDLMRILIYKIDLINQSIVYKPKSFLFEASRYSSRVPTDIRSNIADFSEFPTRNYSFFPDVEKQGENFYYKKDLGEEYSFLSEEEKEELIRNHAVSFLLENYLKITTGLILNENTFNITPSEAESILKELEASSSAYKSSTSKINYAKLWPGPDNIAALVGKMFPSSDKIIRQLVQPKKFDRIFNIIFDPRFFVNVQSSNAEKLDDLIKKGKLMSGGQGSFVLDAVKTVDDPALEAYFAVLETHAVIREFTVKPVKSINF